MPVTTVILEGHILDSHTLSKVLDFIVARGGCYEILDLAVGCRPEDLSRAKLFVVADEPERFAEIVHFLEIQGGVVARPEEARLLAAPVDGVLPDDFYSTTNLETFVTIDGEELRVQEKKGSDLFFVKNQRQKSPTRPFRQPC